MKKISVLVAVFVLGASLSMAYGGEHLSQTQVSQLYVAIFGRASEGEGNAYWRNGYWQSIQGDMAATADLMLVTGAARDYFGATLYNNQAFIEFIYENTLGKTYTEDPDGVDYWVGELSKGRSKGEVASTLLNAVMEYGPDGLLYNPKDEPTMAAYNQFINRVAVSDYMAVNIQQTPNNWEELTSFNAEGLNVTQEESSVSKAKMLIDILETPLTIEEGYELQNFLSEFEDLRILWDSGFATAKRTPRALLDSKIKNLQNIQTSIESLDIPEIALYHWAMFYVVTSNAITGFTGFMNNNSVADVLISYSEKFEADWLVSLKYLESKTLASTE